MKKLLEKRCDNWSQDSIRLISTPSSLARNTLFYAQEVGYFKTQPHYFTERANLESFLLIFTLKGTGALQTDDHDLQLLKPHTCMFLNCMNHHKYYTVGDEEWEFLWLHFYGSSSMGYYQEFMQCGQNVVRIQDTESFANTMWDVIRLQNETSVLGEICASQRIVTLLTEILLVCGHDNGSMAAWPPYIQAVLQEIEHSYELPLTLNLLAEQNSISKYHLSREFKRLVGMNFTDYLTRVRMNHAKELLRFTDAPVNEVAMQCGFSDTSYFIRIFKNRESGITPLLYRKRWN